MPPVTDCPLPPDLRGFLRVPELLVDPRAISMYICNRGRPYLQHQLELPATKLTVNTWEDRYRPLAQSC